MRLIDADALLKKLKQSEELFLCGRDAKDLMPQDKARVDEIYNCQAEILNAPTIDRPTRSQFKRMTAQLGYEPVVHCKDCKHWTKTKTSSYCDFVSGLWDPGEKDFCSCGRRKDDEKV